MITSKTNIYKIWSFIKGPYNVRIKTRFSSLITNEISMKDYIEIFWINKIYGTFLIINYLKIEQKSPFDNKPLETKIDYFLT